MRSDNAAPFALSVTLCTRNRRASLLETLDSVERQRWSGRWEVLVVDNGSSDDTLEASGARARRSSVPMRVIREPRLGLSFARNRALAENTPRERVQWSFKLSMARNGEPLHILVGVLCLWYLYSVLQG